MVSLNEIANFLDFDPDVLKSGIYVFAPELMKPYEEWDEHDKSLNEKYTFPNTANTWKLVSFAITNIFLTEVSQSYDNILKAMDSLHIHCRKD